MSIDILNTIVKDLKMVKCRDESNYLYHARIVYSAMAMWIKTTALDSNISDDITTNGASKKHVFERCSRVLNDIVSIEPSIRPWFFDEFEEDSSATTKSHPVNIIRERMLQAAELIETGFNSDVAVPCWNVIPLSKNFTRLIGIPSNSYPYSAKSAGITWIDENIIAEFYEQKMPSAAEQTIKYFSITNWERAISDERKEYFDPSILESSLYKGWTTKRPSKIAFCLSRRDLGNHLYEYYAEKTIDEVQVIHKIDEYLIERNEHRRFLYGFRKLVDNPVCAYFTKYDGFIKLHLCAHLPLEEEIIIHTLAWPVQYITDELNWLIPSSVWSIFMMILNQLDINVVEETHG